MTTASVEQSYSLAKERYGHCGIDVEAAMNRLERRRHFHAMLAGRRRGRLRERRPADRRHHGHRQLSRPRAQCRRASGRRREGHEPSARQTAFQPPCHLSRKRRPAGRAERGRARAFSSGGWTGRPNWASALDFNPTFFSHPKAADGFTLAHRDAGIRRFWIEHGICCRKIGEAFGRRQKTPCVTNVWIPDGMKDVTIDRKGPREILKVRSTSFSPSRSTRP